MDTTNSNLFYYNWWYYFVYFFCFYIFSVISEACFLWNEWSNNINVTTFWQPFIQNCIHCPAQLPTAYISFNVFSIAKIWNASFFYFHPHPPLVCLYFLNFLIATIFSLLFYLHCILKLQLLSLNGSYSERDPLC